MSALQDLYEALSEAGYGYDEAFDLIADAGFVYSPEQIAREAGDPR